MTNIEKKLADEQSRNFKVLRLVLKKISEYENELVERSKDHYYADSWEQAAQIRRDIVKISDNILFLYDVQRKLFFGIKLTLPECTRLKKICSKAIHLW